MTEINKDHALYDSDEVSLKDLIIGLEAWWKYLLSQLLIIGIAGLIGGVIGLTYSFFKKTVYKAQLSFVLQDEKSGGGFGSALGLVNQLGLDLGGGAGGEFSGDNLLVLMQSRSMVEKALLTPILVNNKKITLVEFYINCYNMRKTWEDKPELQNVHFLPGVNRSTFTLKQDSLLGVFYDNLIKRNFTVDKVDKKLSVITLTVISTNELFSKFFAEVLTKVVSDFYIQTKTEKATKNVAILQRQTDSVRYVLNSAISGVASSIDAAPNPNPALQRLHVPSQRRQIDVTANTAILGELVKNLEISKMSLLQETPLIHIIDKPILPLEEQKIGKIKGMLIGGFIGAILLVIAISIKKVFKKIML